MAGPPSPSSNGHSGEGSGEHTVQRSFSGLSPENGRHLANGASASTSSAPVLAEGAETALLYVRFRAIAEPGLKGESMKAHAAASIVLQTGLQRRRACMSVALLASSWCCVHGRHARSCSTGVRVCRGALSDRRLQAASSACCT